MSKFGKADASLMLSFLTSLLVFGATIFVRNGEGRYFGFALVYVIVFADVARRLFGRIARSEYWLVGALAAPLLGVETPLWFACFCIGAIAQNYLAWRYPQS